MRGATRAENAPAATSRIAASPRNSFVASRLPFTRATTEPRCEYADSSASAERAAKSLPAVLYAIWRRLAGSGGTGIWAGPKPGPPPPPKPPGGRVSTPFGVPSAIV